MTTHTRPKGPFTLRHLDLMPASLDGTRYELIDGELYVSCQPSFEHQLAVSASLFFLTAWDRRAGLGVTVAGPGIVFSEDSAVAPDVVWISRERMPHVLGERGRLRAAPDLVIEFLSPGASNERRDRDLKLELYDRQGVREYWIVDVRAISVQVYRRAEAHLYLAATLYADDALASPLLPGFTCRVVEVCRPLPDVPLPDDEPQ